MTGLGLDSDQHRLLASLAGLQHGSVFKAVAGNHPVIMVRRHHHNCRIFSSLFQVVVWTVGEQGGEHFHIFTAAVVTGPGPADGEFLEAQHIHHANGRNGCGKEFRPLVHNCSDQCASVASAVNRESVAAGIFFADQIFACSDEIIKDILFVLQHATLVPLLTVFAAATQVGHGINATVFDLGQD